jgi:hypothetical protein
MCHPLLEVQSPRQKRLKNRKVLRFNSLEVATENAEWQG